MMVYVISMIKTSMLFLNGLALGCAACEKKLTKYREHQSTLNTLVKELPHTVRHE